MSHTHQIEGATFAEFKAKVGDLYCALYGNASANAVVAGTVTVAAPATTGKADKAKAAKATSAAQSEVKAAVGTTATVVEPEPEAEVVEDDGLGDDEPAITRDDVKTLLIECKNKFKDKATLVGELVAAVAGSYGAKKLADVKDEDLPALHAAAKKQLG